MRNLHLCPDDPCPLTTLDGCNAPGKNLCIVCWSLTVRRSTGNTAPSHCHLTVPKFPATDHIAITVTIANYSTPNPHLKQTTPQIFPMKVNCIVAEVGQDGCLVQTTLLRMTPSSSSAFSIFGSVHRVFILNVLRLSLWYSCLLHAILYNISRTLSLSFGLPIVQ